MKRGWLIAICVLAVCISVSHCLTSATEKVNVIIANVGDFLVLEFDIDSGVNLADGYFTKDGERLPSKSSFHNGKLMFVKLAVTDSGKYHFIVNSSNTTHGPIALKGLSSGCVVNPNYINIYVQIFICNLVVESRDQLMHEKGETLKVIQMYIIMYLKIYPNRHKHITIS